MSWRAIQDTVGRSESLAAVSDRAERLYWRLLAHSDSYGRLNASPAKLRAQCWPLLELDDQAAGAALLELARVGRIRVYHADGVHVLELDAFEYHQPVAAIQKRGKPKLPANPANNGVGVDQSMLTICTLYKIPAQDANSGVVHDQSTTSPRQKRREEKVTSKEQPQPHARANPDPAPRNDAAAALEELGLSLPIDAGDEARVLAWCELAAAEATSNPAGYARSGIMRGEWPSKRVDGAVKPRRPIVDVARDVVRNLAAALEPGDLAAELAELERKRCETIPPAAAAELLEFAAELREGQTA